MQGCFDRKELVRFATNLVGFHGLVQSVADDQELIEKVTTATADILTAVLCVLPQMDSETKLVWASTGEIDKKLNQLINGTSVEEG